MKRLHEMQVIAVYMYIIKTVVVVCSFVVQLC